MTQTHTPDWVKAAEAAKILGINRDMLNALTEAGELSTWRPTPQSVRRWDRSVLQAYLERARAAAGVAPPPRADVGRAGLRTVLAVVLAAGVVLVGLAGPAAADGEHHRHGHRHERVTILRPVTCPAHVTGPAAPGPVAARMPACTR